MVGLLPIDRGWELCENKQAGFPQQAHEPATALAAQGIRMEDPTDDQVADASRNLMLHGIQSPQFFYMDALSRDFEEADAYTVILMNPPFKILGGGCAKCDRLEALAREAVAALELKATITKVKDLDAIMAYDVLSTPTLVINGMVRSSGRVPRKVEIAAWLQVARGSQAQTESLCKPSYPPHGLRPLSTSGAVCSTSPGGWSARGNEPSLTTHPVGWAPLMIPKPTRCHDCLQGE
jgi:small redox-active disulfide protein 2